MRYLAEHKGVILLIIATLVTFSILILFGTNVVGPILENIGNQSNTMVDGVFGDIEPGTEITKPGGA